MFLAKVTYALTLKVSMIMHLPNHNFWKKNLPQLIYVVLRLPVQNKSNSFQILHDV